MKPDQWGLFFAYQQAYYRINKSNNDREKLNNKSLIQWQSMYYLHFYQSTIYIYSVFITSFNIRERFLSVYPLIRSLSLTLTTITILVDYP